MDKTLREELIKIEMQAEADWLTRFVKNNERRETGDERD